ncbi:MAG: hypothetical protein RLZZ398_1716 [Verrucomicrobiota bacterium]
MKILRFTLVAEGTSDRVLIPILRWMLLRHHRNFEWMGQFADLQELPKPPRTLPQKIATASELFPADVIFIHRDSDRVPPANRRKEITEAIESLTRSPARHCVPVIPVRMTEAWLLVSENALRGASGNLNGRIPLKLPASQNLERIPDPKKVLQTLLVEASGLSGRRRKTINFSAQRARIPDFLENWETLLTLPSAKRLDDEIAALSI